MARKSSSLKYTKSNSSDIRFIRLVTGEDIVTEVTDVANGKLMMNNPLKVVYTPSLQTGFLSISLMQWIFTRISKNQTFDMDLHNVLVMTDADQQLKEHYEESLITFSKKDPTNISDEDDDEFGMLGNDDGVEMLNNLINKIKNGKGKLH
jgi:hypothetical protein